MFILLEEAKKHLNIDKSFHDDDAYITSLIEVAEDAVAKHADIKLSDTLQHGFLPASLRHAILLLVGTYYANRENIAFAANSEIPYTVSHLINLNKKYSVG